ncbi:MAG: zinc ribbon domain-containing protein, partial [Negativicutes bacterium]|nr:zinc ribbon domain-containing protein [Negativicutes bacterium]
YYYVCYGRAGYKTMSDHYCSTPYYSAEKINAAVIEKLKEYILNPHEIEEYLNYKQPTNFGDSIKTIQAELSSIDKQMDRWLNAFEQNAIDSVILSDRMKKLSDRKAKLENSLQEYEEQKQKQHDDIVRAQEVIEFLRNLPENWDNLSIDIKRGIIANTVASVTVYSYDNIAIKLDI